MKTKLQEEKQAIISEFNYYSVFDFCSGTKLEYRTISEIRKQLMDSLNAFIVSDEILQGKAYYDYKWHIEMLNGHLQASFRPEIESY